jgi:dTDP-4-amino-4,6-dideoxygalactose transaminase
LFAQLENLDVIQARRLQIWHFYYEALKKLSERTGRFSLPIIPDFATNNAHMFYLVLDSIDTRSRLIEHLKTFGVHAVFHYLSLHKSEYFHDRHDGRNLPNSDRYSDCILRLPMFYELTDDELLRISDAIVGFFS